jgi:hypothetical protein
MTGFEEGVVERGYNLTECGVVRGVDGGFGEEGSIFYCSGGFGSREALEAALVALEDGCISMDGASMGEYSWKG